MSGSERLQVRHLSGATHAAARVNAHAQATRAITFGDGTEQCDSRVPGRLRRDRARALVLPENLERLFRAVPTGGLQPHPSVTVINLTTRPALTSRDPRADAPAICDLLATRLRAWQPLPPRRQSVTRSSLATTIMPPSPNSAGGLRNVRTQARCRSPPVRLTPNSHKPFESALRAAQRTRKGASDVTTSEDPRRACGDGRESRAGCHRVSRAAEQSQ
jgi:hypothetical protein